MDDEFFNDDDFFSDNDTNEINGDFIDTSNSSNSQSSEMLTMQDLLSSNGSEQSNQQNFNNTQSFSQPQNGFEQTQQFVQPNNINQGQQFTQQNLNQQGNNQNLNDYWNNQQSFVQSNVQQGFQQGQPAVDVQSGNMNNQQNIMNDSQSNIPNIQGNIQNVAQKFNLSRIGVGVLVCCVVFLFIALLLGLHSIKFTKKSQQTADDVLQDSTVSESSTLNTQISSSSLSLIEIPTKISTASTGSINTAQGKVSGFNRYLLGNQIIYCIYANMQTDMGVVEVKYFCNYKSYSSVSQGTDVTITYQIVDDKYISVVEMLNN